MIPTPHSHLARQVAPVEVLDPRLVSTIARRPNERLASNGVDSELDAYFREMLKKLNFESGLTIVYILVV
ncbi:MAG: hypothetical protein MHMPM18_001980 [Marteilia pararefringens]